MCREKSKREDRCPCDTSEARRLRRQNSTAKGSYAALATEPVEAKVLSPVLPAELFTAESIQTDIANLHTMAEDLKAMRADSSEVYAAYDKQINLIGAGIEYLAEEKYGAPKDEELREAVEQASAKAEKEAEERRTAARNTIREIDAEEERLREELNLIADRNTHPILKERHALWAEKDPEKYAAWKTKDTESREILNLVKLAKPSTATTTESEMKSTLSASRC